LQSGLGFAVAMNKPGGFIGHAALQAQKAAGLTRRLVQFALDDPQPLLYHNEPIWRDGAIVGRISSGMFGHFVGKSLGMGYVQCQTQGEAPEAILQGRYEIEVAGVKFSAQPSLAPWYDPTSARIKV
jgi:4-methylaminobutanoate oxidase (formaldehyde-forming)